MSWFSSSIINLPLAYPAVFLAFKYLKKWNSPPTSVFPTAYIPNLIKVTVKGLLGKFALSSTLSLPSQIKKKTVNVSRVPSMSVLKFIRIVLAI